MKWCVWSSWLSYQCFPLCTSPQVMSGFLGDLSPQQEAILQKFKEQLKDIPNKPDDTDYFYLRWLRARKFDLNKSEVMFRNYMEHRKKFGADSIMQDYIPPPLFTECLAGGFFGEDLDGHPVWYDNLGNTDPKGIYRSVSHVDEILKYKCLHSQQLDVICKQYSEKKGKHIETTTVVIDFKNLSFQRHYHWPAIEMFKEVMAVEEASNPERSKTILLINTPTIFPFCYNIVKHVLDEKTRKKVVVIGANSNLKEELQKYISLDELPAMYGGNRYAPDAQCSDFIRPGRDVPPKYYLTNQTETSKDQMDRVMIGRGSTHKVQCEVMEEGSTLQWEFFSTDYDISFGVYLKKKAGADGGKEVIRATSRTESQLFPQTGQHTCKVGTYVLKFDNTYSWTRSKEVFHCIKVLPPNVQPKDLPAAGVSHTPDPSPTNSQAEGDEFFECNEQMNGAAARTTS